MARRFTLEIWANKMPVVWGHFPIISNKIENQIKKKMFAWDSVIYLCLDYIVEKGVHWEEILLVIIQLDRQTYRIHPRRNYIYEWAKTMVCKRK